MFVSVDIFRVNSVYFSTHHFRTLTTECIARLMSSLCLLRVSTLIALDIVSLLKITIISRLACNKYSALIKKGIMSRKYTERSE